MGIGKGKGVGSASTAGGSGGMAVVVVGTVNRGLGLCGSCLEQRAIELESVQSGCGRGCGTEHGWRRKRRGV